MPVRSLLHSQSAYLKMMRVNERPVERDAEPSVQEAEQGEAQAFLLVDHRQKSLEP